MMPRYIDLKKALDNICKNCITWFHDDETLVSLSKILNILYNAEDGDVVEVVRCKYCKWWDFKRSICNNYFFSCAVNDFCSHAERREEE